MVFLIKIMQLRDKIFLPIFIISLLISLFLLGATITGKFAYISQTMHCKEDKCYVICRSTSECEIEEVCCEEDNFGICKKGCEKEYEFIPDASTESDNLRYTSQKTNTITFSATTIIILIVGILYYFSRKIHKKN